MGLINQALELSGEHSVTWTEPSIHMSKEYLSEFDAVVVGMAPPTSTAAHRIYGALSVLGNARDVGNLRILLDAPDPSRVWAGLRAVENRPEILVKDFYSKRKEYDAATDDFTLRRLRAIVSDLYTNPWSTTIFPVVPWMSYPSVTNYIPTLSRTDVRGLNLDAFVLEAPLAVPNPSTGEFWVSDLHSSPWTRRMEPLLSKSVRPIQESRWEHQTTTINRLATNAIGCLASTYKNGDPWWSPFVALSLSVHRPVVTDWKLTSYMGDSWNMLAATVETLSATDSIALAAEQRSTYVKQIPDRKEAASLLVAALR